MMLSGTGNQLSLAEIYFHGFNDLFVAGTM
jgi:hypothetical protein